MYPNSVLYRYIYTLFIFIVFCYINSTELVDELGSLAFSIFDGASVSEWRGKDLKLANRIPNIDLLVLGIEQVSTLIILFIHSE